MIFKLTPPKIIGRTPEEDIKSLRRWIVEITDELLFGLNNLDESNIDSDIINEIKAAQATAKNNIEQIEQLQALCRQIKTIVIPSGANLNEYVELGKYIIPSGSVQETILNKPPITLSGGAAIENSRIGSTGIQQIYRHASKVNPQVWERTYFSNAWGDWHKIEDIAGTLLWDGAIYMHGNQTITLSESVSAQANGIVLVFSRYDVNTGAPLDQQYACYFVPKAAISLHPGKSFNFQGFDTAFTAWAKYLYITDTTISGYDANRENGTSNGITYDNRIKVLRNVIGV